MLVGIGDEMLREQRKKQEESARKNEEKTSSKDKISPKEQEALNEALIEAAMQGDAKKVETLLDQGAEINCQPRGITPLHWAAYYDHVKVVKLLLKRKADATIKDQSGNTALHFVFDGFKRINGYNTTKTKVIIWLLVNIGKANINAVNAYKQTPYWRAKFFELDDDVCKVLEGLKACTKNSQEMQCIPELTLSERNQWGNEIPDGPYLGLEY